jgi:hypothetical protein
VEIHSDIKGRTWQPSCEVQMKGTASNETCDDVCVRLGLQNLTSIQGNPVAADGGPWRSRLGDKHAPSISATSPLTHEPHCYLFIRKRRCNTTMKLSIKLIRISTHCTQSFLESSCYQNMYRRLRQNGISGLQKMYIYAYMYLSSSSLSSSGLKLSCSSFAAFDVF